MRGGWKSGGGGKNKSTKFSRHIPSEVFAYSSRTTKIKLMKFIIPYGAKLLHFVYLILG